jgi:hypothetical protein
MITHRWIDARSDPSISARLVRFDGIADALPPDTPRVSDGERREQIRRRQEHVAWRYRT